MTKQIYYVKITNKIYRLTKISLTIYYSDFGQIKFKEF